MKLRKRDRRREEARCVLCHDGIPAGGVTCPTCSVRFHRACHEGRNGCPTYGCEGQLQDLVLPPASSSVEGARALIGAGLLLVVGGLVVAAGLSIRAMVAERELEARGREAAQRRLAAEAQAEARQADERRRQQERAEQERAQALAREADAARAEAQLQAEQREAVRLQRELDEGKADLARRVAAIEAENQARRDQRKEGERLKALETSAAEDVRTAVFRELAMHGSVITERRPEPGTFDRLRAGEWARAVIAGATAKDDGTIVVYVETPGL